MRKGILIGIGILIILLALAGIVSAQPYLGYAYSTCSGCHTNGSFNGTFFDNTHKFNGSTVTSAASCNNCHIKKPGSGANNYNMTLTSNGSYYNETHRYNATTLASEKLTATACYKCHVDVNANDFNLSNGTASYLGSAMCENCHKAKYDNWRNTMHRVILTENTTAQAMNLTLPPGFVWANISFVIIGKESITYMNETGQRNMTYYSNGTFAPYIPSAGKDSNYSCGSCHTTGYNATNGNQSGLWGIIGTWNETGIGCERCHEPAGNGHQVVVNYSGYQCMECHTGKTHGTNWELGTHGALDNTGHNTGSCSLCHQPFSNYNGSSTTPAGQTCAVCHNPHSTTDDQYGELFAPDGFNGTVMEDVKDPKLSFFNATASKAALTDIYDTLTSPILLFSGTADVRKYNITYGSAPINVTGPVSEVLCSMCHYAHGLGPRYIANVSLTHGRNTTTNITQWATCTDCHYQGAGGGKNHSLNTEDVTKSCSRGTECHVTSTQNLSLSNDSIVPVEAEWAASLHNDKDNGFYKNDSYFANQTGFVVSSTGLLGPGRNNSDCMKCHSPFEWNPASNISNVSDFKGITCAVCHNIHDMGESINRTGKVYSWFNRDAIYDGSRYIRNYTAMANTTELCGNCHSNDNPRIYKAGPGWNGTDATNTSATVYPISSHGWPAKDLFIGSFKQKESGLNFECIDCHMYINKTNATGGIANDTEKITGHSFKVNETRLQNTTRCNGCHDGQDHNGITYDTIPDWITRVQNNTETKWNSTNSIVMGALTRYKEFSGVKNLSADKIARAYWNLRLVNSDESWGVHNPDKAITLLDEAVAFADASNASLGHALVSTVNLTAGWNLKALENASSDTSPVSVMSSVSSNITVVWGYNTSNPADPWELYDPAMPASLNDLTAIVSGEGYWIYALRDCVWTV